MTLIPDWQKAYRFLTVQAATGLLALSMCYDYLPALREFIPDNYVKIVAVAIIVARVVSQTKAAPKDKEGE